MFQITSEVEDILEKKMLPNQIFKLHFGLINAQILKLFLRKARVHALHNKTRNIPRNLCSGKYSSVYDDPKIYNFCVSEQ